MGGIVSEASHPCLIAGTPLLAGADLLLAVRARSGFNYDRVACGAHLAADDTSRSAGRRPRQVGKSRLVRESRWNPGDYAAHPFVGDGDPAVRPDLLSRRPGGLRSDQPGWKPVGHSPGEKPELCSKSESGCRDSAIRPTRNLPGDRTCAVQRTPACRGHDQHHARNRALGTSKLPA